MRVKYIQDILISFLLFAGLLYAFVPFESSSIYKSILIHSFGLFFVLGIAFITSNFKIKINLQGRFVLIMITLFILIGFLVSWEKSGLIFALSIIFTSLTAAIIKSNSKFHKLFVKAFKILLTVSISTFFVQKFIYLSTGTIIDFHKILFPFSEARIGLGMLEDLKRMGGLYIEPGTYSNMVYIFLIVYMVLDKKPSTILLVFGAISIILSYSVWGMVFGSFLLIMLILIKLKKISVFKKVLVLLALLVITATYIDYVMDSPQLSYLFQKVDSDTGSVVAKEQFYQKYSADFIDFLILGEGYAPPFIFGLESPQDSGFLLNLSVVFGILFAVTVFIIYAMSFLRCCNWQLLLASLPIFISKIFYYEPTFWLLFFLLIYKGFSNEKKVRYKIKI